jgi:hypothetical protein
MQNAKKNRPVRRYAGFRIWREEDMDCQVFARLHAAPAQNERGDFAAMNSFHFWTM